MVCETTFEKIRKKYKVPAYKGVKIKTKSGEIGVITGTDGYKLKVYFQESDKNGTVAPDKVAYMKVSIK